jgi:hypothetical protein
VGSGFGRIGSRVTIVSSEMNQPHDFDDVFRKWAGRPPATSATDAARAIVARVSGGGRGDVRRAAADGGLPPLAAALRVPLRLASARRARSRQADTGRRPVRLSPAWATVVAAGLVLVAGTAAFIRSLPSVATGLKTGGPTMVPARDADVVLWLDEGTPVYVFLPGDGPAMR